MARQVKGRDRLGAVAGRAWPVLSLSALLCGCANVQLPLDAKVDLTDAKRAHVVFGVSAKNTIDYVTLCTEFSCLDVGPFASAEDVYVLRLTPGTWCPTYAKAGHEFGVFDSTRTEACFDASPRALSYPGHLRIGRGEATARDNHGAMGPDPGEAVSMQASPSVQRGASDYWVRGSFVQLDEASAWASSRYPDLAHQR